MLERRLDAARRADVFRHIDACVACRELVAASATELSPDTIGDDEETTTIGVAVPLLVAGACVDQYRVERRLGTGGMGEVYLARDTELDRPVALKLIKAELLRKETARTRFLDEARATARLNHPNIVTIHGVGEHLGQSYVALELVDGMTLRRHLRKVRPSTAEVIRIGREIAGALAAAHAAGVVHRDLNPANVMLCGDGRVKVLDFGLAEFSDREGTRRTIGGTPTYMAPEQWAAYPATGASDVWSLGVILYEMATGQRLFRAEEGDDMAAIRQQICAPEAIDVRPLGAAGMPEALVALVARCLAKRADVRPTAAEVDDALMPLQLEVTIASVPSLTPPPSSVQPVAARSGRRWWLPAGAVAGVLLVVALFFVLTRDGEPAVDDEGPAPAPVARAEHAGDVGEAAADATPEDDPGAADEKGHDGDGDGSAPEVGNPPAGPRPAPRADEASKTPDTPGGADPKKEPEPKEPWDPMSYR